MTSEDDERREMLQREMRRHFAEACAMDHLTSENDLWEPLRQEMRALAERLVKICGHEQARTIWERFPDDMNANHPTDAEFEEWQRGRPDLFTDEYIAARKAERPRLWPL